MLLLPLAVLAQENDGRIDFDADIFTGKAKAYEKKTSAIFFENVYFELGGSVGKDTGQSQIMAVRSPIHNTSDLCKGCREQLDFLSDLHSIFFFSGKNGQL